jgi:hypothetical protein
MADDKCTVMIGEPPWYIHEHRCRNNAQKDGLCGVHLRMKERREARKAAYSSPNTEEETE